MHERLGKKESKSIRSREKEMDVVLDLDPTLSSDSHNVSFTTTQFSNPNLKSYKLRTLTVFALGADTFDGTTLAIIGGGSVAAIAAVISLAEPEKRRQLQVEEVGGQVHVSGVGAVKKVYRGFDQEEGRDVAWNQVKLEASVEIHLFSRDSFQKSNCYRH
uniref:Uncharacterized protein n=1 Tax=Lactuca sativa TaxID=4236 RepID=A0A9R1W5B4_LACSA|nr:hypothetical protein LSAT_V11C300107380 [Lactuca sativa]